MSKMMSKLRAKMHNPFFVMGAVVLMFIIKAGVKIWVGGQINSPMIAGDGWHNVADIFESFSVVAVMLVAVRPKSVEYPFGRGNIEFFASLFIGGVLMLVSFDFAKRSLAGIADWWPAFHHAYDIFVHAGKSIPLLGSWFSWAFCLPAIQPVDTRGGGMFLMLVLITLGSLLLSLTASRAQLAAAKRSGHSILRAAGEETLSDSRVELVTLFGIIFERLFHLPWLEYPLALLVAGIIFHTGYKLCLEALRVLHQHSLESEHVQSIQALCLKVPGVQGLSSLVAIQIGHTAQISATLTTMRQEAIPVLTYGVQRLVKEYALSHGFMECQVDLTFEPPAADRHRIAYAVICSQNAFGWKIERVADTIADATHILVCDIEHGSVDRTKVEAKPDDVVSYLTEKRAKKLFVFDREKQSEEWADDCPIELDAANSYLPAALGVIKPRSV